MIWAMRGGVPAQVSRQKGTIEVEVGTGNSGWFSHLIGAPPVGSVNHSTFQPYRIAPHADLIMTPISIASDPPLAPLPERRSYALPTCFS